MDTVYLGIDLAKNVFQLCGLNPAGKQVYTKRTGRKELLRSAANIPAYLVGSKRLTIRNSKRFRHSFLLPKR